MKIFPVSGFDEITLIASSAQPNRNVRNVQHINLSRKWYSEDVEQQNIVGQALKGHQECGLTGKVGGTATGLSTTTTYYFKIAEDDEHLTEYNIETAGDVTFAAIIVLLNIATTGIATWSLVSGDLRCTSDTYGSISTVRMTAGTSGTDLFAALTNFTAFDKPVSGKGIALPSVAILDGHNLTIDAVVKIQGSIVNDPPGDPFDPTADITMVRGTNGIYYALAGFLEKEYWRFLITDPSNTDGYFKVGRLWLGSSIDISGPERASIEKRVDTTVKSFSRSGQSSSDTGYRYRVYDVSFPHWTDAMKDNVELFIKAVRGAPFYVLFDEAKIDKMPPLYAVLGNEIDYENIADLVDFRSGLIFREVF